jgi:hypothetical protein
MLQVREDYVDATRGCRYGDSGAWQEAFTDDRGQLYRALMREYGRCTSKVYVDDPAPVNGDDAKGYTLRPRAVGWVFVKRVEYDDAHRLPPGRERTYLREVWVTVREVPDTDDE